MHLSKHLTIFSFLLFFVGISHSNSLPLDAEFQETLHEKEQSLILVAAFTANGDLEKLDKALNDGLNSGLTVNQLKEVIVHSYAYCGFPRSIRGLQTFIAVLEERKKEGIKDEWGAEASPVSDSRDKYSIGKDNLDKLVGRKLDGPKKGYAQFSPEIEVFLKEHLFADIFERDVLTYKQRELVTISVLASIRRVAPMLRTHMNICLIQGWTPKQLEDFTEIIAVHIGKQEGTEAKVVLKELLESNM